MSKIISVLSTTEDEEICRCLNRTLELGKLFLPKRIDFLNESLGLVPQIAVYYLSRVHHPSNVVETGVWTGKTTWFILNALADNGHGRLISIDLGISQLRKGSRAEVLPTKEIGGLVPKSLRDRWQLLIGDSTNCLPELAGHLGSVDLFLHDSEHSYSHMMFEFETMWPVISTGGFLCSDDIGANQAWLDFLRKVKHVGASIQSRVGVCRKTG